MLSLQDNGTSNLIEHHPESILDNVSISINGNGNKIKIGKSCLNNVVINITGDNSEYNFEDDCCACNFQINSKVNNGPIQAANYTILNIGRAVRIDEGLAELGADNTKIDIGHATSIVKASFYAVERETKIVIGEHSLISWNVEFRTSDWHSVIEKSTGKRLNPPSSLVLSERVWIGSDVRILKGIHIGRESIVGAGSIVTRNIESNCAVGGNPAKVIKRNVTWNHDAWVKNIKR